MPDVYRHPERFLIELTGPDRVQWLHNLCTNDILQLATDRRGDSVRKGERVRMARTPAGRGCFAAITNRQGKMIAECAVRLFEERVQLETAERTLPDALGKLIIMEEVDLAVREAPVHTVSDLAVDAPLFHFVVRDGVLLSPTPFGVTAIGEIGGTRLSEDEYERRRIAAGWPRWGIDMDATVLPMEAGLEPIAISYAKGCYVGQEVIQRVKTYSEVAKQLVSLECDAPTPRGTAITAEGGQVGRVTSAAGRLALGYVRREHRAPGTRVDGATVRGLAWQKGLA